MLELAGVGLIVMAASYCGVAWLRRLAERRRLLDIPNERSSHSQPTPYGGGLAIVVVTIVAGGLFWLAQPVCPLKELLSFFSGALLIAGVSWLDDFHPLPNRLRFAVHLISAVIAVVGIGFWKVVELPLVGRLDLGWPGLLVTILWIVGLTNAYNFMDGIDGLAGGQGLIAGLGWAQLGGAVAPSLVAAGGWLLAGSCLGFLGHNWPPARIFMGDVGSAFLGYSFAVLAVIAARQEPVLALAGALLVWPFVFDTLFTFFRRLRRRENVFSAHRSHLYQRLVIAGLSHEQVTLLYLGLALLGAMVAASLLYQPRLAVVGLALVAISSFSLWRAVLWRERRVLWSGGVKN